MFADANLSKSTRLQQRIMSPNNPQLYGEYGLYVFTVMQKEVTVQYLRYAQKLFRVYCGATEDLVDVGTVAV